jgi:hypothetical protein
MARRGSSADPDSFRQIVPAPGTVVGGRVVAPGANVVIADSGALPAGDYRVQVLIGYADTLAAGKCAVIEHRNAANAATVDQLGAVPAGDSREIVIERLTLAASERIRVVNDAVVGAAGSVVVATVIAALLP